MIETALGTPPETTLKRVRALHDVWCRACAGRAMPSRADIDPAAIGAGLLPYVALADAEPSPFRVRYRLVGTKMAQYSRVDFTGRYLDELGWAMVEPLMDAYRRVWETGQPLFGTLPSALSIGGWYRIGFAIFPLAGNGGGVEKFLGIEDYDDLTADDLAWRGEAATGS